MLIADCAQPQWHPRIGWRDEQGSCLSFTDEPPSGPVCPVSSVLARARQDGAPPAALAQVSLTRQRARAGWIWTYDVKDPERDVQFSRSYEDGNCEALKNAEP